jgi:hypothetical protein
LVEWHNQYSDLLEDLLQQKEYQSRIEVEESEQKEQAEITEQLMKEGYTAMAEENIKKIKAERKRSKFDKI